MGLPQPGKCWGVGVQVSLEEPRSRISAPRDPLSASWWDSHRVHPEHVGTSHPLLETAPRRPGGWTSRQSCLVPCRVTS